MDNKNKNDRAEMKGHRTSEYWSRRPGSKYGGGARGKSTKVLTHRIERRVLAKQEIAEQVEDKNG